MVTDRFQSTRPMRGATDRRPRTADRVSISIHAPHAGRDNLRMRSTVPNQHFNPRAPCGARRNSCILSKISHHFNPRAPCGARRTPISSIRRRESDFNPRAPCGARHKEMRGIINGLFISIHAPHAGRDARCKSNTHRINISIHAPHAGRDDILCLFFLVATNISIHAPHAGRDSRGMDLKSRLEYFNPRAPCGARRINVKIVDELILFQSTRPMRGATDAALRRRYLHDISIHAPHAGRDKATE